MLHADEFIQPKVNSYYNSKLDKHCSDDILAFDIETSSAWWDGDTLIGYSPLLPNKWYNEARCASLVYLWSFAYNDDIYYGRTMEEFLSLLKRLNKSYNYVCYIHNEAYEFQFMLNVLHPLEVFARQPRKPMKVIFREFPNIEFRCSYMLTRLSLKEWGKTVGEYKEEPINYTLIRTPKTVLASDLLKYSEQDVRVMVAGLKVYRDTYGHIDNIPLTQTGRVRREARRILCRNKWWMAQVKRTMPRDAEELRMFTHAFYGGYTHANYTKAGEVQYGVTSYDFASSYPYVMCAERYPMTPFVRDEYTNDKDKGYIIRFIARDIHSNVKNTFLSASKCEDYSRVKYDNGRILSAERITVVMTGMDFELFKKCYDCRGGIEILDCYSSKLNYLPKEFILFILQLYKNKTELKNIDGFEFLYRDSKEMLNSLFGMMVSALLPETVTFDLVKGWKTKHPDDNDINKELHKKRYSPKEYPFLMYQHGVFITSYAKQNLFTCLLHGDNDRLNVYSDTDSLKLLGKHDFTWYNDIVDVKLMTMCMHYGIPFELTRPKDKHGIEHPLGYFCEEYTAEEFKTLGAKRYVYKKGGEMYMTCSGVSPQAVACLKNIDEFEDNFEFKRDHPDVKNMLMIYIDGNNGMNKFTWNEGEYDEWKDVNNRYGICGRKKGYVLSVEEHYKDLFNDYRVTGGIE